MRALWIAKECSLQDRKDSPGLVAGYEHAFVEYGCDEQFQLAIAFSADGIHTGKTVQKKILYYPVDAELDVGISETEWEKARTELLKVVEDYRPDIIQCFGSEWPYGLIAKSVGIPVVIHMMGFLNVYYDAIAMARGLHFRTDRGQSLLRRVMPLRGEWVRDTSGSEEERRATVERRVMAANRFFFGRTEWDLNLVRYYSPNSTYFRIEETLRPLYYKTPGVWRYHFDGKLKLFTLSSGDDRKGNEIILRTAKILGALLQMDFEWRVAGSKDFMPYYEKLTGIGHQRVSIELLGKIEEEQIVEELKAADFFIHPSIIDNSPHSVCEAQMIGCPVIASNVGGVPQLVEHGVTGWLYPYNEPHSLVFLIGNLLRDTELLLRVSKNAVKTALERHDPETIVRKMKEAYETIITN